MAAQYIRLLTITFCRNS